MEILKVTKAIALKALLFGACKPAIVGSDVKEYSTSDLIWAEKLFTEDQLKAFEIPLWLMSGYGYRDGNDGYGEGYGYGDGKDGYSYGNGSGNGNGYGNGKDGYGCRCGEELTKKILELVA